MMNDLKDTVELMQSNDYKERFRAEYYQTKIRYNKLHTLLVQLDAGTAKITPKCHKELLKKQCSDMGSYLYDMEVRACIEEIDL